MAESITTNLSDVSMTMAKHLFSKQQYRENNVVFSPLSLQIVVSIIAAGSDGPTHQQLLDFLRFKSTDHLNSVSHLFSDILKDATPFGGPRISLVNGVWVDQSLALQTSFKEIVAGDYKATLSYDGFKVLRLPYVQGQDKRQFSMYFFLLNAKDGLYALVEKVTSESELLLRKLPCEKVKVGKFAIPKFKFSFGLETSDVLKELGVVLPFSSGDFTKMVIEEGQHLFVSNIFHKCFVEVDEEGTEAAASNCAFMTRGVPEGIDFIADHPFLFLIREDSTQTILFVGQVLNPLAM